MDTVPYADFPPLSRSLWSGYQVFANYSYFPRYYARSSVLGSESEADKDQHVVYTDDVIFGPDFTGPNGERPPIPADDVYKVGKRRFSGSLFEGESEDELPDYSFIGFV